MRRQVILKLQACRKSDNSHCCTPREGTAPTCSFLWMLMPTKAKEAKEEAKPKERGNEMHRQRKKKKKSRRREERRRTTTSINSER